jgi:hypothetical protein
MAQGKCSDTLKQAKPDKSSHVDNTTTAVDLSQNDQIQWVAETSPVAALFSVDSCSLAVIAIVMWRTEATGTKAFVFIQYMTGECSVFSDVFTDPGFFQDADKYTNDIISNFIIKY